MRDRLLCQREMGPRWPHYPLDRSRLMNRHCEIQPGLPPAEQFEIDCSEQPAVDLGPMLDTLREVDVETPAQGVEARGCTRKPHPCQRQSVDKSAPDRISLQASQFGI